MAIKKNDAVILDAEALAKTVMHLREWFPDSNDWKTVSQLPNSVGIVISVKTREKQIQDVISGLTKLEIVQTAEVAWPEGIVKQCPVQFLLRV